MDDTKINTFHLQFILATRAKVLEISFLPVGFLNLCVPTALLCHNSTFKLLILRNKLI